MVFRFAEYNATKMDCQTMERISERIRTVIEHKLDGKKRTQALETSTGISGETWRKLLGGKQNATLLMLEAVCKQWPEYAFWLATGISDEKFGHQQPEVDSSAHGKIADGAISSKLFNELMKLSDEITPRNPVSLDELHTLTASEMIRANGEVPHGPANIINILGKIRWTEIFLDNYITELSIDDAISAYNQMRGITKKLEADASKIGEHGITDELLKKFIAIKDQLEKQRDWIIERNAKEEN